MGLTSLNWGSSVKTIAILALVGTCCSAGLFVGKLSLSVYKHFKRPVQVQAGSPAQLQSGIPSKR